MQLSKISIHFCNFPLVALFRLASLATFPGGEGLFALPYSTKSPYSRFFHTAYITTHKKCSRLPMSTKMWKTLCIHFRLLPSP